MSADIGKRWRVAEESACEVDEVVEVEELDRMLSGQFDRGRRRARR